MKKIKTQELAEYALFLAFAMIVSYIEVLIPIPIGIPGAKLGLANVAILFCLYKKGPLGATLVNLSRVVLCSLLFGSLYSMLYSFVGAVLSLSTMILLKQIKSFSMIGVSITGGVSHNIGQLIVALIITQVPVLMYYVPFLLLVGALTGLLDGLVAKTVYVWVK